MFDLETVSRPYAIAAYEYANSANDLQRWADFLSQLSQFTQSSPEVITYFQSFSSQSDVLIDSLVQAMKLENQAQIEFLKIIQRAKRLGCVKEIYENFLSLKRKKENTQKVVVQSAFELSLGQKNELESSLQNKLNKTIELSIDINPDLMGGFVVKIDDFVIDQSVKAKLNKLKTELLN